MPKTPTRKLKVFQAQFGFFDTVLAVPSQAAAMRTWGTHRNLFATGHAKLATDEAAIAAALEHPGILLRRAIGSNDPFAIEPTSLPKIPDLPKPTLASKRSAPKETKPQPKPKPRAEPIRRPPADGSALDAAEAALREVEHRREQEEAEFDQQEQEFNAKRTAARESYVEGRKRASAAVVAARQAYRRAGGTDPSDAPPVRGERRSYLVRGRAAR